MSLVSTSVFAAAAFDFGLPIFGIEEVRFEQSKDAAFNEQLLKKYISEHETDYLARLDAISKWSVLIKLSDSSRRNELVKFSHSYFSCKKMKKLTPYQIVGNIFAQGLLLEANNDKNSDNKLDEKFEDLLLEAEDRVGNNPNYLIVKGIVFYLLRNRPNRYFVLMKPEEDLKRALLFVSKTAHYYFVMGQAFRFLGNKESSLFLAIASYEKSSSLAEKNIKLQNTILGIYMGLHESYQSGDKAEPFWLEEAVYKKIIFLSPNNPYALNNLGYLYSQFGINRKMAQQLCRKAVSIRPDNAGFRDSYGWASFKNKDYETAEAQFKKSIELKNGVYDPYYHLATLYYITERLDLAADNYIKALQINPDSAESLNNLAYLFAEQGKNLDNALKMSKKAVRLSPSNASYLDTLGWIYFQTKKYEDAQKYLEKASKLAPGEPDILMHLGKVFLELGKFTDAIDYLKEAKKNNASSSDIEDALYLALCVREKLTVLADFHNIFGAKVNKTKICNILAGLARIYQEEGIYNKAIFYTKLCADIKSGKKSLDKPLFPFYKLKNGKEEKAKADVLSPKVTENKNSDAPNVSTLDSSLIIKNFPPISINIGPAFFNLLSDKVAFFKALKFRGVSIFVQDVMDPANKSIIRLFSKTEEDSKMIYTLACLNLNQLGAKRIPNKVKDTAMYKLGNTKLIVKKLGSSVYFTVSKYFTNNTAEFFSQVFKYKDKSFIEVIFNWNKIVTDLPPFLLPLFRNPFAPFQFVYSKYSLKNGGFKEFSALSLGHKVSDKFMKRFARKLLVFKLRTKQMGLNTTIQTKSEGNTVYVSTYFENISEFLNENYGQYLIPLKLVLKRVTSKALCFANRLFYSGLDNLCPDGGKMLIDPYSGTLGCSIHKNQPVSPFFLTPESACKFSRIRLKMLLDIFKYNSKEKKSIEKLVNKLIHDYNIPLCPEKGIFSVDENGTVGCSKHKN